MSDSEARRILTQLSELAHPRDRVKVPTATEIARTMCSTVEIHVSRYAGPNNDDSGKWWRRIRRQVAKAGGTAVQYGRGSRASRTVTVPSVDALVDEIIGGHSGAVTVIARGGSCGAKLLGGSAVFEVRTMAEMREKTQARVLNALASGYLSFKDNLGRTHEIQAG